MLGLARRGFVRRMAFAAPGERVFAWRGEPAAAWNGPFDMVFADGCLCRLPDDDVRAAFAHAAAVLAPGGRLVALEPLGGWFSGAAHRPVAAYAQLARSAFAEISLEVRRDGLRRPLLALTCRRPAAAFRLAAAA